MSDHAKERMWRQQGCACNGCREDWHWKDMTIDHVVPWSKGGPNRQANYQLLCPPCNKLKADGTHAELLAKLRAPTGIQT